jgi:hypothetical protein
MSEDRILRTGLPGQHVEAEPSLIRGELWEAGWWENGVISGAEGCMYGRSPIVLLQITAI